MNEGESRSPNEFVSFVEGQSGLPARAFFIFT